MPDTALIAATKISVGQYHHDPYELQIRYACEDIAKLRERAHQLEQEIQRKLESHEVGKFLTTIGGGGPLTAACIIAETGDPARFRSAAAIRVSPRLRASYQRLRASGKWPKVAMIAAMHKLLAAIYSVAKHRQSFIPRLSSSA
ncbi:MAG: transposase [Candidatus Binataceae bacterium]